MLRTRFALLVALCLTGCSSDDEKGSDLAAPVTAPMRLREHMIREVDKNKVKARKREEQFDSLLQQER